ncbi:MAG: Rieske 2Fe-2S domain-containing protein [Chloroflexota bacterium]
MNTADDFVHTGPGTLPGRYMRTFWQPVYEASKLAPERAVPLRIMSEDFTLYRGHSGKAHVVSPRCAHRGTRLSTGWVEDDCIRCFYHGWKYDASGQCVEMPAEDGAFPPKVRIRGYPTEEYLGLIFAYLGEGAPPSLPHYTDFEDEGVLEASSYVRPCSYFNNVENQVDPVHLGFVHRASAFSSAGLVGVPEVSASESDYGIELRAERPTGVRVSSFLMPTMINLKGSPEDAKETGWRDTLAWRVPIDDAQHHSFNVSLTHLHGEAAERYRQRRAQAPDPATEVTELTERILRGELRISDVQDHSALVNIQDNVAQIGQGVIANRIDERLGRSDAGVILLRKIWSRELQSLAEGTPLKQWIAPARVATTAGV